MLTFKVSNKGNMKIMEILLLTSWILGILLSILFTIGAWITKDKKQWENAWLFFVLAFFTGYITTIPIIFVCVVLSLSTRFRQNEK